MRTLVLTVLLAAVLATPLCAMGGFGVVSTIGSGADAVTVLHTGGTPYQIGYWHGYLLKNDVKYIIDNCLSMAEDEVGGASVLLTVWEQLRPYVPADVIEELNGLAEGSGIPIEQIYEMHAIPDAAEFHCSNFCAGGTATANGHSIQMRILDWAVGIKIQDRPLIIVAEPIGGPRYTNLTFAGMIGSLAGFNSAGIGIGEMGDSFDYDTESLSGIPLEFLMKEVIAHSTTFADALSFMQHAHRTSSLWYTLGDCNTPTAALCATSATRFQHWAPGEDVVAPDGQSGPGLPDICYGGHYNDRLYADLKANWGKITLQKAIDITRNNMMPHSNLMDGVWDLNTGEVYVAYAEGPTNVAGTRPFVYLNTGAFKTPPYVVSTSPAEDAFEAPELGRVVARFSMALDPATISSSTVGVVDADSNPIAGAVTYEAATRSVVFVATDGLPLGAYTVTLKGGTGGLTGTNGATMVRDYTWSFTVPDDSAKPQLSLLQPVSGEAVRGQVALAASAVDSGGIDRVEFFVDRVNLLVDHTAPYEATWNTLPLTVTEGRHTILVRAYDHSGNMAEATAATYVDNTTFDDVGKTASCWQYVETVVREGISQGCSQTPPLFCPSSPVSRGQMAVFVCRAAGWAPSNDATPLFLDVPRTDARYAYIQAIARHGVTQGCSTNPPLFCPNGTVTRGQMAVFLCRAMGLAPYAKATSSFTDVPKSDQRYTYIEALYRAGITAGCSAGHFCPDASVLRGQMAVFLCRAFHLSLQ